MASYSFESIKGAVTLSASYPLQGDTFFSRFRSKRDFEINDDDEKICHKGDEPKKLISQASKIFHVKINST